MCAHDSFREMIPRDCHGRPPMGQGDKSDVCNKLPVQEEHGIRGEKVWRRRLFESKAIEGKVSN
jgi:hypothetical protein